MIEQDTLPVGASVRTSTYYTCLPACRCLHVLAQARPTMTCIALVGASLSEPHRGTHSCCAVCIIIIIIIIIIIRPSPYRIFLNVSTRFFFTVTSRHFTGHTVQSSSSWTCSLTSPLETDRGTEVSHYSLRLLLLCSVE